jgi:peptidoglycan/LPS O-acetylase OafA/YrhL
VGVTASSSEVLRGDHVALNRANRIAFVDAMRAAAVLLVVIMHSGLDFVPGDGGVTIFFCISGYIITTMLLRERARTHEFAVGRFYLRRLLKLGPPFVVIVLLPTLVFSLRHVVSWLAVASQVFFTYNWTDVFAPTHAVEVLPGSSVVWSLAVEEQFYIAFALLWLALVGRRRWRVVIVTLSAAAIVYSVSLRCVLATDQHRWFAHVARGTDARMEAIAWGVLVAVLYAAWQKGEASWCRVLAHDMWVFVAAALFIFGSLVLRDYWPEWALRPTVHALAAALLLMYGLVRNEERVTPMRRLILWVTARPLVQVIGLASYSIYLCHLVLITAANPVIAAFALPARVAMNLTSAVIVGIALYYLVEVPVLRLKQRWAS